MGLFKRAHVRGIAHELTRQGVTVWPSKLAEEEAADAVADDLDEEEVPEVTDEEGLSPEQAAAVVQQLVEVADEIAQKTGGARDVGVNKLAASTSYEDAAYYAAASLMQKAAEEASTATGPDVPGVSSPSPAMGATAETALDAQRVPSAAVVGPPGTTDFSTQGAGVGREVPQDPPGAVGSEPTGDVAKLSHILKYMSAIDGASLSGGTELGKAPAARKDLPDNLNIPGAVASSTGMTGLDMPAAAMVGVLKANPAGTPGRTAPTNNDVAADAKSASAYLTRTPQGRSLLRKLSEEAKKEEEKEEKKEEEECEEEETKEAQLRAVVQRLAGLLG